MFSNVLIGVDGDEGGRDAIALAKTLVAGHGELTVAYVFGDEPRELRAWAGPLVPNGSEHAGEMLEQACAEAGISAHVRWRAASSVGRGLHELAEITEADLLVVGSSRHGLVGRVRLGDHTRAALNGAPCAVAVAPVGYGRESPPPMREIGVGYDGSPESQHALSVARKLAADFGSELSAFQAVSIPAYVYRAAPPGSINDVVRRAREQIAGLGGVEPHAAYGNPVEELTVYSSSLDLLVVGSRGYGPLLSDSFTEAPRNIWRALLAAPCSCSRGTRRMRRQPPADRPDDESLVGRR